MSEHLQSQPVLTVEGSRRQAAERIESYFSELQDNKITAAVIPGLLESQINPVAAAASRCTEYTSYDTLRGYMTRSVQHNTRIGKYMFTKNDVLAINNRPEIRSLSVHQLAETYDVSRRMIIRAAQTVGIIPVFATVAAGTYLQEDTKLDPKSFCLSAWYDLDQTLVIKDALQQFNAPPEYISEEKLLGAFRIAPVALKGICKRLDIDTQPFHNPEAGRGEMYLTKAEAGLVFNYIKKVRHQ